MLLALGRADHRQAAMPAMIGQAKLVYATSGGFNIGSKAEQVLPVNPDEIKLPGRIHHNGSDDLPVVINIFQRPLVVLQFKIQFSTHRCNQKPRSSPTRTNLILPTGRQWRVTRM